MPIPESQLKTWSHQGAVDTAKKTHESIRDALSAYQGWPEGIQYEVYLQGSYKNDTNIRGDSDVDVVAQLNSSFCSNLSEKQKRRFGFSTVTYDWNQFKSDVLNALRGYYGRKKVTEGRKCVKVQTPHLPADVVVCLQYRKYPQYPKSANDYVEGMTFYVPDKGRWVMNYPKLHYDNGVQKNAPCRTDGWYKPTVRLFKNARTYLIEEPVISADLAPSYFLECFLYNVPDTNFGSSFQVTFRKVVDWLNGANLSQFVCQNKQLPLFGNSPEQWSQQKAREFLKAMEDLWTNWK